jgi:hypothetical protein
VRDDREPRPSLLPAGVGQATWNAAEDGRLTFSPGVVGRVTAAFSGREVVPVAKQATYVHRPLVTSSAGLLFTWHGKSNSWLIG